MSLPLQQCHNNIVRTIVDGMDGFIYGEVVNILGSDGDNSVSGSSYLSHTCAKGFQGVQIS